MDKEPGKGKTFIALLIQHITMAQISSSAAVLAYYTLLSIFPAVMVVGNLLPMIGIDAKTILAYLSTAIPESVYDFIQPLIYDFLRRGSGGVLTTGALIALWSTSQGIAAFSEVSTMLMGLLKTKIR